MAIRTFTCTNVVAGKVCGVTVTVTGGGPLPSACDDCKKRKAAARKRRARSPLAVVEEPPVAPEPVSPPVPAPELPSAETSVLDGVRDALAALDVGGVVMAPALKAAALALGQSCDLPQTRGDIRMLAAGVRELRGVMLDLTPKKEGAGDGDPLANLRPSLVDPAAS